MKRALLATLVLAAIVRFWGLWYGLPHPLARPDEEMLTGHAMDLSLGGHRDRATYPYPELLYYVDPSRGRAIKNDSSFAFPYPGLVVDIDAAALAVWRKASVWTGASASDDAFVADTALHHPDRPYRVGRVLSAICGVLTVWATFIAARYGYGRPVALMAALLVAVDYLHARESHYATVDAAMVLFVTLAMAMALKSVVTGARRDVVLSGGFVGLAASAKYNAAAVAASTVVAAAAPLLRGVTAAAVWRIFRVLAVAGVLAIVVFAATSPYSLRYYQTVDLGFRQFHRMLFDTPGPPAWKAFVRTVLPGAFGWIGFAAVAAGLVRAVWKHRVADLVLFAFIVPTFISMAGTTWVVPRYPVVLVPALSMFAADFVVAALPAARGVWMVCLAAALAIQPLGRIVQYDWLASKPDTRLLASAWIAANVPAGSRIAICRGYGAPIVNGDARAEPAYDVAKLLPCSLAAIRAADAPYVVTHTHPDVRYFAPADDAQQWLETHAAPIAAFSPFPGPPATLGACYFGGDAFYLPFCALDRVERGGPIVTVWKVAAAGATPSR